MVSRTRRQISRKAIGSAAQQNAAGSSRPVRRSAGTVAVSSGPPAQPTESANGINNRNSKQCERSASSSAGPNNAGAAAASNTGGIHASAAGHTYDQGYGKWAKFDVDAALRSVDDDGQVVHKV